VVLTSDPPLPFPIGYADAETRVRREVAQDYIRDVANHLRETGVKASGIAVTGAEVATTILDLTRPDKVGLLALATHGQGGLCRMVLGSVADKLVRAAEMPVLVLQPRSIGRQRTRKTPTEALQHSS
jgi:nucleotide-binding universal stress UspA family protein